ncbi:diguanylate cyclase (GGDEF)-like protein [Oxalobacteraceae bacterium GrIS 1.11]
MKTEHDACPNCLDLSRQLADKDLQIQALIAQTEALAQRDSLTGVLNRRSMSELLQDELNRSYRSGHPFCFAIISLDHHKAVSEKHGAGAADLVLRMMSDASVKLLRILDRFGRLQEEEFGIILPGTWLEQGGLAMARLKKTLSECDWESVAPGSAVTFSAGLTSNAPGDTADTLIKRAEKALAQAKELGSDSIVQYEEDVPLWIPED